MEASTEPIRNVVTASISGFERLKLGIFSRSSLAFSLASAPSRVPCCRDRSPEAALRRVVCGSSPKLHEVCGRLIDAREPRRLGMSGASSEGTGRLPDVVVVGGG